MNIFFKDSSKKIRVLESEVEVNLDNQEAVRSMIAKNANIKAVGAIMGVHKQAKEERGLDKVVKEPTFNRLMRLYYDSGERRHLRLGQWFINHFVEGAWPELYYEEDEYKASGKIYHWLLDNKLTSKMPKDISTTKG